MIPDQQIIIESWTFRKTMGLFATGVTVLTTEVEGRVIGMTANSVTSVSLEPPLLLVCVHKKAKITEALRKSGRFSISILNENQRDLSCFFANMWTEPEPPPFTFKPWIGGSRLEGTIGAVACQINEFLEGGDHWIVIGQVIDLHYEECPANPLLFCKGQYRQMLNQPLPMRS